MKHEVYIMGYFELKSICLVWDENGCVRICIWYMLDVIPLVSWERLYGGVIVVYVMK